jgi:hypothetical protein
MKEIIKGAVVIDPALRGQMTLVTIKKSRVFIVPLKFNQRKMVSLHKGAKPCVINFASRTRHLLLVVKVAGNWHTEQQWVSMNACERAQEQLQIGPAQGGVYVLLKLRVTTTKGCFLVPTRSLCHILSIGGLGSAYASNKLRPIGRLQMALRGGLDLVANVMERRKMILQLQYASLCFSERPERAENDAIEQATGSQAL